MVLPQWLAKVNRVATNRVTGVVAPHLPGMGVVGHVGRRSGRRYRTPVMVFQRDGGFVVALTYGVDSQWVNNVLAAGRAEIVHRGRTYEVTNPRVVHDPTRALVPAAPRVPLRVLGVDDFLLVDA
jgi:deazaflavin-dependent oxidoreductase (nitroreductase family)